VWSEEEVRERVEQAGEMLTVVATSVRGSETGREGVRRMGRGRGRRREREGALRACRGWRTPPGVPSSEARVYLEDHGVLPLTDALQFGSLAMKEASCLVLKVLVAGGG